MSLAKSVEDYKNNHLKGLQEMKEYYKKLKLESAIKNAASGMTIDMIMNNHQYRIGVKRLNDSAIELLKYIKSILLCKSFDEIFSITERVKDEIYGLGDLWSYDTSLRIGFNLAIYPDKVYVQRGVKKGVKKALGGVLPKGRSLSLSDFPKEIRILKPYEAENFLCIWGKGYKKMKSC